ncbi:MAG: hypothetical protein GF383_03215 [Candidatus Lokiarchaeota archaeon]|nr:hypothetical protein [Candidatus Lokiarchaeota archaeon]MBD3338616.1 hypothetical protein [Candidatus Lokiarchaeota archaeon]
MNSVRFGAIGSGGAWYFHYAGTKWNPKIKFNSLLDVDEKRAKKAAKRCKCKPFTDLDKFLESDIDAVLVMVPHYLHEKYVVAAAKAGKHVLCEKPMATTLEECDNMINETKKAGVKFMIAENHRFLPAHRYVMEAVNKGLIGKVFLVRAYEGVNEIPGLMTPNFWKGDPIMAGGGSLMDMGAHKFATLNWILNDTIERANCWITRQCTTLEEKAEDNAMVMLKYKNGIVGEIVVSFTVVTPPTNRLEVYGTKGTILEDHAWQNPVKIYSNHDDMGENKSKWYEPSIEHAIFPVYYEISARLEDDHFVDCILQDKEPEFTPEQAKEAIASVLLSYLSARRGKTATINDLLEIQRTKGTKSILEGLEEYVQNNYCIE